MENLLNFLPQKMRAPTQLIDPRETPKTRKSSRREKIFDPRNSLIHETPRRIHSLQKRSLPIKISHFLGYFLYPFPFSLSFEIPQINPINALKVER